MSVSVSVSASLAPNIIYTVQYRYRTVVNRKMKEKSTYKVNFCSSAETGATERTTHGARARTVKMDNEQNRNRPVVTSCHACMNIHFLFYFIDHSPSIARSTPSFDRFLFLLSSFVRSFLIITPTYSFIHSPFLAHLFTRFHYLVHPLTYYLPFLVLFDMVRCVVRLARYRFGFDSLLKPFSLWSVQYRLCLFS